MSGYLIKRAVKELKGEVVTDLVEKSDEAEKV
jgi:hypothetical protein